MGTEICFDDYLESVKSAYQQWWRLYTLTDATGRESQRVERDRIAPAFFDFGLMVQTVDKEKVESQKASAVSVSRTEKGEEEKKEKIERLPVLEGICKYAAEHVLLVGRPGSGKSTALARLLLQEAENALSIARAKIPVLVELRYLPSEANESSVCDRILTFMHKHDPALNIDEAGIKQLLRQGRLLLLVDGVNELPSDRGRVMVNQFRELYQKTCSMIFTTRELSAGGDLGIAKRLEMQPLTEPQMQQFVMAYLPTQGERLLRQLSGRLREFGQTPLLLWMLCSLFQQSEQIPENLGRVFQVFTQTYENSSVRNHEVAAFKKNVQPLSDRRLWKDALKHLASKMMQGNSPVDLRTVISKDEIIQEFKLLFKDELQPPQLARDCLDDLLNYHLIQIRNEDKVEFRHQLIQEYYAAEWLLGLLPSLSDARLQQFYLNYLKWTEPLALMLELVEGEEQAVRVVRLALEVDLRLGARLSGAVRYGFQEKTVGLLLREIDERKIPKLYAIELLGKTRSEFTFKLIIQSLKDIDFDVRKNAVKVLGQIGNNKEIKILVQLLKDKDPYMCRYVAGVLKNSCNDKAVIPLISILKDEDSTVRFYGAESLGNIVSNEAVVPLIQLLKDKDSDVRYCAAESLGEIGNEKAVESLIQALEDVESVVREYAADALGTIGSERAVEPLIQAIKDEDPAVRFQSTFALRKINSEQAVRSLIQYLKDEDLTIRDYAAEALGYIGNEKAVKPLIETLNDSDVILREYIVESLGKIGSKKAIKHLIQALKDEDPDVRAKAATALGNICSERAIEPLIQALKDEDSDVREQAANALGNINSIKTVKLLIPYLEHKDIDFRVLVANILGSIGHEEAVEPLIQSLKDTDSRFLWATASALGEIGSERAVEPLIQSLNDIDFYMRMFAAEALGKIGSNKAIDPLIQSLNDPNIDVRSCIVAALGGIGNEKVVEPLIQSLNDPNIYVSILAADALGKIASTEAVEPLIESLKNPDFKLYWEVAEALSKIGCKKAIEPLIQSLKDQNLDVREKAAKVLGKISEADHNLPTLTQQLPHLLTLIPTESSQQALSVITAIQARCKYYNYTIAQTPLQETENHANPLENTLNELTKAIKNMPDAPKIQFNINSPNNNIIGNVQGDFKNFQAPTKTPAEAAKEIQDLLAQLNLNTKATNEPEQKSLVTRIIQAIQKSDNLRAIFIAGGIEGIKLICSPLGIPIEMGKKLLEAAEKEKQA